MQVKLMRQSGMPVNNFEEFRDKFKAGFDDIKNLYDNNKIEMKEFEDKVGAMEAELFKDYEIEEFIEYPNSVKKVKALQDKYDASILTVQDEDRKLVLIIMDLQ